MNRIARTERATTKRRTWFWVWRFVFAAVILGFLATLLIRATVVDLYRIESVSMQPTLNPGQSITVDRRAYGDADPQRGDVVVFDGRGSFLPYQRQSPGDSIARALRLGGTGTTYVKRVIGIGGDTVECCGDDGRILVNGTPVDEPYLMPGDQPSQSAFSVEVPAGRLWVMGDHRSRSEDSRALLGASGGGMIPIERVEGRVGEIIWPMEERATVD
ncbi:signal peptidase I [Glutamicibacter sp. MNS18]|uniref:signal peptidase I n=1 Tax=Glutamicibacter sp. MNS18 TaxID=2989817 RepID=UPI0022357C4F|nr:signal peptidase I [Glutamicibacter sp. MNS18]MCW4466244.1 signal peptidase I [Glutamicibacter sp. MNS18]